MHIQHKFQSCENRTTLAQFHQPDSLLLLWVDQSDCATKLDITMNYLVSLFQSKLLWTSAGVGFPLLCYLRRQIQGYWYDRKATIQRCKN